MRLKITGEIMAHEKYDIFVYLQYFYVFDELVSEETY